MIKNLKLLICTIVVVLSSCYKDTDNQYDGKNYIYLTNKSGTTITVGSEKEQVDFDVVLANKVSSNTTLKFKALDTDNNPSSLVAFQPENIELLKGTRNAKFSVVLTQEGSQILEPQTVKLVAELNGEAVELKSQITLKINPAPSVLELTEQQKALIEKYLAKGINILPFIGKVKVKTVVQPSKPGILEPFMNQIPEAYEGEMLIALSENSTDDKPILEMTENAMGMAEFFHFAMRKITIEDEDYFIHYPVYKKVDELIEWNKDIPDTFDVSLSNIAVNLPANGVSELSFLGKRDKYGFEINVVPFNLMYSAWERLLDEVKYGGQFLVLEDELDQNGSSNPYIYLNQTDILEDEWQNQTFKQNYNKGSIDYTSKTMKFQFMTDYELSEGYVYVTVEIIGN